MNILKLLLPLIKPAAIIKEIRNAPEGGKDNLYRPAIIKLALKFGSFWLVLVPLLIALGVGWITFEQLLTLIGISQEA